MNWIKIIIAVLIIAALCVFGILGLLEGNERLKLLREQETVIEKDSSEKQTPQATQTPAESAAPSVTQYPSIPEPSAGLPVEPSETQEDIEYPGGQDLDDYGDWLPPYEPPETKPATVYRNETIIIPIE